MMRLNSIRTKISLQSGLVLAATTALIVSYSSKTASNDAAAVAEEQMKNAATAQAEAVRGVIERALEVPRALAITLQAAMDDDLNMDLSREDGRALLQNFIRSDEGLLTIFTCWEIDGFDELDMMFSEGDGVDGNDYEGRFVPSFRRSPDGELTLRVFQDDLDAAFYALPRDTGREYVSAPQTDEFGRRSVRLTVPIRSNETYYGIVGVDLSLDFLQDRVQDFDLYTGQAELSFLDPAGSALASNNEAVILGEPIEDWQSMPPAAHSAAKEGKLAALIPFAVGPDAQPWGVQLSVPEDIVLADAAALEEAQIRLGGFAIAGGLLLIWVLAGRLSRPLSAAAQRVRQIANGDLSKRLQTRTGDEVGDIGRALNHMADVINPRRAGQKRPVVGTPKAAS